MLSQKSHIKLYLEQFYWKIYVNICTFQSNKSIFKKTVVSCVIKNNFAITMHSPGSCSDVTVGILLLLALLLLSLSHYHFRYFNSGNHCIFGNQPKEISVKYVSASRSISSFRRSGSCYFSRLLLWHKYLECLFSLWNTHSITPDLLLSFVWV
jgi:hypothetical protein